MAVRNRARQCPRCGSRRFRQIGAIEANEVPGVDEDTAVYQCGEYECQYEWDSTMTNAEVDALPADEPFAWNVEGDDYVIAPSGQVLVHDDPPSG